MDNQQNIAFQIPTAESLAGRRSLIPAFFGLAIMFFFFTFCELSCQGQRLAKVTGIELATGTKIEQPTSPSTPFFAGSPSQEEKESKRMPSNIWAIIALAAALTGLTVFLIRHRQEALIGLGAGAAGTVALLLLQATLSADVKKEANGLMEVDFSLPYWGALLALAAAAGLSFLRWQHNSGTMQHTAYLFVLLFVMPMNDDVSAQANLPFHDGFEDGSFNPDWWAAHPNLSGTNGVVQVSGEGACAGQFSAKLGKITDGGFTTNALDLKINLLNQTEVVLEFCIADVADETHNQDGIYFSDNGGASFTKVYDFKPELWCDGWGRLHPLDVDKLAADHLLELTSEFIIRFQQHDDSDIYLGGDSDGLYIDEVRVYDPGTTHWPIPFTDNFNTGVLSNAWLWRASEGSMTTSVWYGIDPAGGIDYSPAVFLGNRCDQPAIFGTNALDLHLDLEGESQVALEFWIRDIADETHDQDGIYFSDDGGVSFTKVYDFKPELWCDGWGRLHPLDVDKLAADHLLELTSEFIIRFQQHDDSDIYLGGDADGLYIDEVRVYDPGTTHWPIPFTDNFNTGVLSNAWLWRASEGSMTTSVWYGIDPAGGIDYSPAVFLGNRCDQPAIFGTNALDLHLDLEGESQVALEFWIRDIADETHDQDGIYFSDDGGVSFTKVYDFKPELWCDGWGRLHPLDVDKLAADHLLELTSEFIIRFQQHDDSDIYLGGDADGLYIDEVRVYDPGTTHWPISFTDNFNTGVLSNAWLWRAAEGSMTTSVWYGIDPAGGTDNSPAVFLGNRCDQPAIFGTNALDLHLNCTGAVAAILSFDLKDFGDETHNQDGILLSNDGGQNFKKIYDFNLESIPNGQWTDISINLYNLAVNAGLPLNGSTIVRFQQHDDSDIYLGGDADGILLDNINITGTTNTENHTSVEGISVSPNPASDALYIKGLPNDDASGAYQLLDISGRILSQGTFSGETTTINVAALPAGFFLLKLSKDGRTTCQKIQKL